MALTPAGWICFKVRQREGVVVTVAAFDGLQGGVDFQQKRWFIYA